MTRLPIARLRHRARRLLLMLPLMAAGASVVGAADAPAREPGERPAGTSADGAAKVAGSPEQKALAFLAREVSAWRAENHCFSCHNNGDAARALFRASKLGFELPQGVVDDTLSWLSKPESWQKNGGDTPFDDQQLAELQFAAALADALDANLLRDRKPLRGAADKAADWQNEDGSWSLKPNPPIGSPTIWPRTLTTVLTRRTLAAAPRDRKITAALQKADRWLSQQTPHSVIDAAALLLAEPDVITSRQRAAALELIAKGQSRDGGWGPFVTSPPEAFDTAIVLLALARSLENDRLNANTNGKGRDAGADPITENAAAEMVRQRIRRGRAFLVEAQLSDGSWQETTRPPGAESYAQRMSTAGWATLALLATQD